jgi:sugar lactone lactonase YvrE
MFKKPILLLTPFLTALTLAGTATAQTEDTSTYELPGKAVYPEGIAYDPTSDAFYVGSASDGTIFRGDLETGEVTTLIPSSGREAFSTLGMKVDAENHLWVAGGTSGQVFVYDLETAEQTSAIETPGEGSPLLNDLTVSAAGDVYVTDSYRPVLFKVSAGTETAEPWLDFSGTAFEYQQEGPNANGITVTPDNRYLLVVQMNTGQLYRIDIESQEVRKVDLGGETLAGGDGLVLDGRTLYTVIQTGNEIVVLELAEDFSSGTVTSRIEDASLAYPATAVKVGDRLLVVNAQFDKMEGEPVLPFTVSSIPVE